MTPVVTCQETDTLDDLMAMMTTRRSRHLPVVTDNELVDIISIGEASRGGSDVGECRDARVHCANLSDRVGAWAGRAQADFL
jgi:hypothetical protein